MYHTKPPGLAAAHGSKFLLRLMEEFNGAWPCLQTVFWISAAGSPFSVRQGAALGTRSWTSRVPASQPILQLGCRVTTSTLSMITPTLLPSIPIGSQDVPGLRRII